MRIQDVFPTQDILLALEPEELAGPVLKILAAEPEGSGQLNSHNFTIPALYNTYEDSEAVSRALIEAWVWLEREGLLAPRSGGERTWVFVTRRGRVAADSESWDAYRTADTLPRRLLHPSIVTKVWVTYLRGDYDTAVFQAFKLVEVNVRNAAGEKPEVIGQDLMNRAFNPDSGPLSNLSVPKAERQALMLLFAGAIGSYKNPHSHRAVDIGAEEACEMIMLASHLLQIVDQRAGESLS